MRPLKYARAWALVPHCDTRGVFCMAVGVMAGRVPAISLMEAVRP
jgi:hypothetical protein